MALIARTATIQARVFPGVKEASERVLWRIGLNMSEAMELFLRRVIVDERIPFEIVALDGAHLGSRDTSEASQGATSHANGTGQRTDRTIGGGNQKKFSKSFSRGSTNTRIHGKKNDKKGSI